MREDLEITERLYKTGEIIGIPLLDHVIIDESGQYYSMKERGNMI
jgi:DNA repair protein RadC